MDGRGPESRSPGKNLCPLTPPPPLFGVLCRWRGRSGERTPDFWSGLHPTYFKLLATDFSVRRSIFSFFFPFPPRPRFSYSLGTENMPGRRGMNFDRPALRTGIVPLVLGMAGLRILADSSTSYSLPISKAPEFGVAPLSRDSHFFVPPCSVASSN